MRESPHRGSLLVIFLTVFVDLLGFGIVLPLLPIYAADFTLDESGFQLGLLMASFSAMQFVFAPLWGRLSDRMGRRPVILIGLVGSVVFYALFGVATIRKSLALLFVSRIGAGLAGATISTAQAYIADSTSLERRPRGMALVGMAFGLGFTFGPLLGYLAVPTGTGDPGPWPGFAAAGLSTVALILAFFLLPESLHAGSQRAPGAFLDLGSLRTALAVPSIAPLLLSIFVCVLAFAGFETTLSLMIHGKTEPRAFEFSFRGVCLTYAYIGFVLAVVQGGIVRRLAGHVAEGPLALFGALAKVAGFMLLVWALYACSLRLLLSGLTVIVIGFAFLTPTLNSLVSRRSDPARQGSILGVGQSISSLARILGSAIGIPLLKLHPAAPLYAAAGLMSLGFLCILRANRSGGDYSVGT